MPYKDFFCITCGHETEDVEVSSLDVCAVDMQCQQCETVTRHEVLIRAPGNRWRFCDFPDDPAFYRGQCRSFGLSATTEDDDGNEIDMTHVHTGEAMAERERFSDDARDERRDMIYHKTDRKRGRIPLFFDQAKRD